MILAVFIAIGVVLFFVPNPLRLWKQSEEAACREQCTRLQKSWRLVPANPNQLIPLGKFDGPWTCQCY